MINTIKFKNYGVVTVLIALTFFYIIIAGNFFHNILSFLIGDPYDAFGIFLVICWPTGVIWTILQNRETDKIPGTSQSSNLYRIVSLRERQLLHVSAAGYNEGSRLVIARFKPTQSDETTEMSSVVSSITGNFRNSEAEESKTDSASNNSPKPTSETKTVESGSLANINTSIKGVSQFDEEKAKKFKAGIKNFGSKKKESTNN